MHSDAVRRPVSVHKMKKKKKSQPFRGKAIAPPHQLEREFFSQVTDVTLSIL